jgi:hypothetical protein
VLVMQHKDLTPTGSAGDYTDGAMEIILLLSQAGWY